MELTILAAAAAKSADEGLVVGFKSDALGIRQGLAEIKRGLTVMVRTEPVVLNEVEVRLKGLSVGEGKAELTPGVGTGDGTPELPVEIVDSSEAELIAEGAVTRLEIVPDVLERASDEGSTTEVIGEEGVALDDDSDEDGVGEAFVRDGTLSS